MIDETQDSSHTKEQISDDIESHLSPELLSNLFNLWMHHDNAAWRAISWVIPIEAGIIAAAFKCPGFPGFLSVAIGSLLIILFAMYAMKSFNDRDRKENLEILDLLKPKKVRLTDKNRKFKGSYLLLFGFCTIIFLNIFLGILEFLKWRNCDWAKNFTETFFKSCS